MRPDGRHDDIGAAAGSGPVRNIVALRTLNPGRQKDAVEHAGGGGRHLGILVNEAHQSVPDAVQRVAALHRVSVGAVLDGHRGEVAGVGRAVHRNHAVAELEPW